MDFSTIDAIYYALAFVVPGFVAHSVLSTFQRARAEQWEASLLRFLTLSAINYALWSWLVYLLLYSEYKFASQWPVAALWGFVILIAPVLLGIALGYSSQKYWVRRWLQRIGLRPIHVVPTAWDWRFGRMEGAHWLLITFNDGSTLAGLFGGHSFASSDPGERDIYVEQVYSVAENGEWARGPEGKGILISAKDISSVEFWPAA